MHIVASENFHRNAIYRQDFLEMCPEPRTGGRPAGSSLFRSPRTKLTIWSKARQIDPTGKLFRFTEILSSPKIKNISLFQKRERWHICRHPGPTRGALAIVTNVGRGAVDAEAATDERG
jgi:hypothetical protein